MKTILDVVQTILKEEAIANVTYLNIIHYSMDNDDILTNYLKFKELNEEHKQAILSYYLVFYDISFPVIKLNLTKYRK